MPVSGDGPSPGSSHCGLRAAPGLGSLVTGNTGVRGAEARTASGWSDYSLTCGDTEERAQARFDEAGTVFREGWSSVPAAFC
ncbi:hypothetical protein AB0I69_24660 [Streptomyces sp. NPDC050508]|uniref:hypothetical protein n=1 Tax=Streptomyces sp. NPDC050508 TaxID=3155405 RepID=UPI003436074D